MQSLKCLLTATRFSESLLLGRVNSCHGFHERIVIHASGFYTLTLSADQGDNAANKLTAECSSAPDSGLGDCRWDVAGHSCCAAGFTRLTRLRLKALP